MGQLWLIETALAALLTTTPAPSQPPADPPPPRPAEQPVHSPGSAAAASDAAFLRKAAEGGQVEVELARLATQRGQHADVKAIADRIERDHTEILEELTTLAARKQIALADGPATADPRYARLSNLSGAAFDQAYAETLVEEHERDVREFERAAKTASDPDVRAFAEKRLPALKAHLEHAQQLVETLGETSSRS